MPAEDTIAALISVVNDLRARVAALERLESHSGVTLDANSVQVNSLTGQELGLQVQAHSFGWFGPTSGAPAIPTFREVNLADMGDYIVSTWTPTVGGDATYTSRYGLYAKIGQYVHLQGGMAINVLGTGNTNNISGIPFTCSASASASGAVGYCAGLAVNMTSLYSYLPAGGTAIGFYGAAAAAAGWTAYGIFQNGCTIVFSLSYRIEP